MYMMVPFYIYLKADTTLDHYLVCYNNLDLFCTLFLICNLQKLIYIILIYKLKKINGFFIQFNQMIRFQLSKAWNDYKVSLFFNSSL